MAISESYTLKWGEYLSAVKDQFKDAKDKGTHSDLLVVSADLVKFHVHKIVLAISSSVLWELLGDTDSDTVILHEINGREFESILNFIYNGEVQMSQEELPEFFSAAQSLQVKGLMAPASSNNKREESILVKALLCNKRPRVEPLLEGPSQGYTSEDEEEDYKSDPRIRATDPRPCPKCGKIYRSAHTLRTHLEDKHTLCPGYRCVLCGTVAKSRNSLHSHMSRQHRGISTKDLPVLAMPAPFDPDLARRLLTGQGPPGSPKSNSSNETSTGSAILDTYLQLIRTYNKPEGEIGGGAFK